MEKMTEAEPTLEVSYEEKNQVRNPWVSAASSDNVGNESDDSVTSPAPISKPPGKDKQKKAKRKEMQGPTGVELSSVAKQFIEGRLVSSFLPHLNPKQREKRLLALLKAENNELRRKEEATSKKLADLEVRIEQHCSQQRQQNQMIMMWLQKLQPQPPYSSGTQQSGQSQPLPPYPCPQGTQQFAQNQPPGAPVYPSYPMFPTHPIAYMQQPPYLQQPPMSYMHQPPPYQMPVYRPEMPSPDGICPDVPIGGFSGMLASAPLRDEMARIFGSQGRSEERSREAAGSHSSPSPVE